METQGAVDVMRIDGTLNAEKAKELASAVGRAVRAGVPMVMCDLTAVQLVDSDGLEALLDAHEEVTMRGGAMKLAGATPLVSDILRLTGAGDRFEMFDTASAGVGSFAR
ncbi:MAG: STAS domain-containing protein [Aeoliella sp.]